ncbi:MAG: methyltransferase domain-containing protein [Pseudomonadota bacterium]|nr:methyltransferase domain-containing protein [Pseudomonadota bacterium]
MSWYDTFATIYDGSVENVYRAYRPGIVAAMALAPGERALDLACGTGPNLPLLADAVGPGGEVLGVDFSEGMLARARRRVAELPQVRLLQRDARTLTAADVGPVDAIVSTLGISVIPDHEAVLAATWALVAPGGRFVIFDIYAERWVPSSAWIKLIAQADLYRRPWDVLEGLGATVERSWLEGSPHVYGGRPYLMVARKS